MSTKPEPLKQRWYPVINDLIGGWAVALVDKPLSEIDPMIGEWCVGDFMDEAQARHVAELHNTWLEETRYVIPSEDEATSLPA